MNIILLQDLDKVGNKHEVVKVKDGYGRNYLIPQGLAVIANKSNMKQLDLLRQKEAALEEGRRSEAQSLAEKLQGATLKIGAKVGETGKIFGSVTNIQIAKAIAELHGVTVERKHITLEDEVKTIGTYTAIIQVHKEVEAKVPFEVVEE